MGYNMKGTQINRCLISLPHPAGKKERQGVLRPQKNKEGGGKEAGGLKIHK